MLHHMFFVTGGRLGSGIDLLLEYASCLVTVFAEMRLAPCFAFALHMKFDGPFIETAALRLEECKLSGSKFGGWWMYRSWLF